MFAASCKLAKGLLSASSKLYLPRSKQRITLSWDAMNRNAQYYKSSWATRLQPSASTIALILSSDHDRGQHLGCYHKPKHFSSCLPAKGYRFVPCYTSWDPSLNEDARPWPEWIRHAFSKGELGWCARIADRPAIVMVDVERNDLISFFRSEEAKRISADAIAHIASGSKLYGPAKAPFTAYAQ